MLTGWPIMVLASERHVHHHPLAQFDAGKVTLVGVIGGFGPCTAVRIVKKHFWHPAAGLVF
jgi:hypothetical protein